MPRTVKKPSMQAPASFSSHRSMPLSNDMVVWIAGSLAIVMVLAAVCVAVWQMKTPKPLVVANLPPPTGAVVSIPTPTIPEETEPLYDVPEEDRMLIEVDWLPALEKVDGPRQDVGGHYLAEYYRAGTVKGGPYAGKPLLLAVEMGLGSWLEYIIQLGDDLSGEVIVLSTRTSGTEIAAKVKGIDDLPEEISLPNSSYKLRKNYRNVLWKDQTPVVKLFRHPELGDFYLMDNGCIMVELPDHTAIAYELVLPFVNNEDGTLNVTFADGEANTDSYGYNAIIGCGAICYYLDAQDAAELKPSERLRPAGKFPNGEIIYEIANGEDPVLKELYADENTMAYYADGWERQPKSRYTYEQFLAARPLLYWKDPLGRWIQFKNRKFEFAAEMCKPVIYLYPTEDQELMVQVHPNGGFTYTRPEYGTGWHVLARPNGEITDLKDGKTYPYLFWEGIGMNYPVDETGFVVKKSDLTTFFDEKLAYLGLNAKEAADFKEYWVDRLSEKPYYKLHFLKKTQFDEIAPLDIGPVEPRTVIRVMLTAEGLDAPVKIPPQELEPAPARDGFTLVEWGGVVLK